MPRPKLPARSDEVEPVQSQSLAVFVIGCGGYTEALYFEKLVEGRDDVRVQMLKPLTRQQAPHAHDLSSPMQTVERVHKFWENLELESGDQVWIVLDVDDHFKPQHLRGTEEALAQAQQHDYQVVISNPCFELWLLMHTEEVLSSWECCDDLVSHLRLKWKNTPLKGHNKSKLSQDQMEHLRPLIRDAIARGHRSANSRQMPPANPGTQVHLLLEALDAACGEAKLF